MTTRQHVAFALAFALALPASARAADVGVTGLKLIVLDNTASTGKAKAVFVTKDPNVVKGSAADPAGLVGSLEVFYTDQPGNLGSWQMPDPWQVNNATVAKYVNKLAPAGGGVKVATVKPGTVAKVVAKNLGDAATIDLFAGGTPGAGGVTVAYLVRNATDSATTRMCARFSVAGGSTVSFKETAGGMGRKLVARNGVAAPCPGVAQESVAIASGAMPVETPGTGATTAAGYPDLVTQYGTTAVNLNRATYTRYFYAPLDGAQPTAILILIPGFEGGAASFKILAEQLIQRARPSGLALEVWGFDRRGHQLEDRAGLAIAAAAEDPQIALDWYFGNELGLVLHPALVAGPNRRAIFHDTQAGTAFMANWTNLVFSRDIDAVVEAARAAAANQNVFLGGHSAGTGFTARYAATDLNLSGVGPADPGYAKLRGLVLLEGGGAAANTTLFTTDSLDRMEDRADGGLFYAVRDNAPRCVDGTACMVATEAADCAGKGKGTCTPPAQGYVNLGTLLSPRILASGEVVSVQVINDPDTGQGILAVDQGAPGNNVFDVVPDFAVLNVLIGPSTAQAGFGAFVDDDGAISAGATFVRTSVGAAGPIVGGLRTWLDIGEALPGTALPFNGAKWTTLPGGIWGQEIEVTRIDRMLETFRTGDTNFTDWYYPAAGPSTTSAPGTCTSSTCSTGNVGASCTTDANCTQSIGFDSSALSGGRNRRDIENLTQGAGIDVPVIAFGGSNGLTPIGASFIGFAQAIGTCTAPSCTGATPRVVDALLPNPAFPTYGDVDGGYEVHITEGIAHIDVVTAEDTPQVQVIGPLLDFLARNVQ